MLLKRVSANDADAVVVSAGWTSESRLLPKSSKRDASTSKRVSDTPGIYENEPRLLSKSPKRDASTLKRVSDTPGIDEAASRVPLKSSRRDVSMLKRVSGLLDTSRQR